MIVDNTINYTFRFKTKKPLFDDELKEAILSIGIRSYQYEYDDRRQYKIYLGTGGDLLEHGAFLKAKRDLPKQLNFTSDVRDTLLYKVLKECCVLEEMSYPETIDENEVFKYFSKEELSLFMKGFQLGDLIKTPEFEVIPRIKEATRLTERDLPSFM